MKTLVQLIKNADKAHARYQALCRDILQDWVLPYMDIEDHDIYDFHVFKQSGDGFVLCYPAPTGIGLGNIPVQYVYQLCMKKGELVVVDDLLPLSI